MGSCRKAVAVACIALVVVAAVLPLGGVSLNWIVVPSAFVLLQPLTPTGAFVDAFRLDAPNSADRRTADSRGPPSPSLA